MANFQGLSLHAKTKAGCSTRGFFTWLDIFVEPMKEETVVLILDGNVNLVAIEIAR